jgi:hypothetical protein
MKAVLKWKPLGKRPLGRPKQRWIDKVKKILGEIEYKTVAKNRNRWKLICIAVMGLNSLSKPNKKIFLDIHQ